MKYVRGYLIIFAIIMLIGFGVYFWMPDYRCYLLHEDSLVENLSASLYLISFIISLLFFLKSKTHRKVLIALSAVSLLGFLDELSFGERLFGLTMPTIWVVEIDAAHDLFSLTFKVIMKLATKYPTYLILFLSIGMIIGTVLLLRFRFKLTKMITNIYREPPFIFVLIFSILLFIALVIDLELINNNVLFMIEELFEMNAALALLFCGLSLKEQLPSN